MSCVRLCLFCVHFFCMCDYDRYIIKSFFSLVGEGSESIIEHVMGLVFR